MKLTPPTFRGKGTDLEAAEWWLECIETKLTFYNCPENHKVLCATYLLEGPSHFGGNQRSRRWRLVEPQSHGQPSDISFVRNTILRNRKAFMQL